MDPIFSPWQMGTLEIPNRLLRSATWEGLALDNGAATDRLAEVTADLARGGVGLIITGYAYVAPDGLGLPRQTGVYSDVLLEPLTRVSDAVHAAGGLVALQIVHAGAQTRSEWTGSRPVGPSAMVHPAFGEQVDELGRERIADIVSAFAAAARRAADAGFDAVQLHAAHGYLINQFLSPDVNLRDDDYGGPIENRARFCLEVYDAVRDAVGPAFPVFVKLNSEDAVPGGLGLADAVEVARSLDARGIDAIEVSGGVPAAKPKSAARAVTGPDDEGYFLANARRIKAEVGCPVIVVGGFRSRSRIEEALRSVDAVAMSRPFIRQPDLANLLREGVTDQADCISCGRCFAATMEGGLGCGVLLGREG
jgi:2,4-dienoyl-CoA reductase-like NADH-dependent reductase (Old Yellow Enzyme family)